ncbi:MAG: class I SAM-dependent methyltransferase [Patescibacteria group bacterium]|nr:class I SAM-dependent methyltransferase [Patescibacteria group bacterium]
MVTFLDPEKIIEQLGIKQDWNAAEFGCGQGGFTIELARVLPKGMVYALDIQEEPLSALLGKAKVEGLSNIKTIQCDLEEPKGSTLRDGVLDLVLVTNILFQSTKREEILREAKRILNVNGKIIVVDWKVDSPFGPEEGRVSLDEIEKLMRLNLDMKLVKKLEADTYHWSAIFEK